MNRREMKPKLLVVELWQVGDLVMATPFLRAASRKFSVTLLAKPFAKDLQAEFWPEVDVVTFVAPWTAFEHKYRIYGWPWREIFRLLKTLRRERFDIGVSARMESRFRGGDPRDHLLLALAGARRRIGFRGAGSRLLLNQSLPKPPPDSHRYEHWRALAQALELEVAPRDAISLPSARKGCILVHTGAAQQVRVWPMDRFHSVIQQLRGQGYAVEVACDPNQRDYWLAAGEADVITPRTITELIRLMDRAGVFIGNDSGPGHIAAFSGLPTYTIFGPQLPERFAPLHRDSVWVEGRPCPYRPCSDYCHFHVPHCIWNLEEAAVAPRIHEFIARHTALLKPGPRPAPVEPDAELLNDVPAAHKPRRILYVNNSADIYGASRMLLRFLKTADRRRFEGLVVLPEQGLLKDFFEAQGVEVVVHPRLSVITRPVFHSWRIVLFWLNFPFSVFFLWRLIRQRKIEMVHTNTGVMISAAMAARLAGVPHVWHIRDWFQEFRSFWPVFSWYIRKLSRRIVAVSNAVAGQFEPQGSAMVIHDGFSLNEFQVPRQSLGEKFRSRYQLADEFVVGCVGRIKYVRKGQEILVRAAAILKQRGRPIKALIVGAPFPGNESHLTQLQDLVRELGIEDRVVLTGELPDARPAYAAMNLLALTSAQPEPFGGVVMEAMAMELPVVATNIGGSVDQVLNGVTGLLVPPGDPAALADAIEKLMGDPELCRRMGAAAVQRIREKFTLADMTVRMEQLFEEVISENQHRHSPNGQP